MEDNVNFGATYTSVQVKARRLRMARALTGCSRQEIYEKTGIATSTIDTWESGRVELTPKSAERVCNAFRMVGVCCCVEWLLEGTGAPPRIMDAVEKAVLTERESNELADLKYDIKQQTSSIIKDDLRKELDYFISLHKDAMFTFIKEDFMNSRFKVGDCVAGCIQPIKALEGSVVIAELEDKSIIVCKLIKCIDGNLCEISFGMSKPRQSVRISHAAEIVWHRMVAGRRK